MSQTTITRTQLSTLEESLVDHVSNDEPSDLLERFAVLERVSGTEDEQRAAEYITDRLDALGVDYDRYDPELYISQPKSAAVRTTDGAFEAGPVKTVAFSESASVTGELVYVGTADANDVGSEASSNQYHAVDIDRPYRDIGDLSGKIALTAAGSLSIRASRILEDAGAIGVIAIHEHDREPHSGIATPVWGGAPPLDEKHRIPGVPIANVRRPDGVELRERAESDGDVRVELSTKTNTGWMDCPIVVADIAGGSAETDEFVLLHGHYDSWYVGITDNATGDAGLLELARVFEEHSSELQRNLRVAWWPAHSTGRYAGSTWYADEFALDFAENCVAHIDMDSPGAKGSEEYTDMSCWMPEAHGVVASAIEDVTGAPYQESRPRRAGDYSFNNLGVTGAFTLSSNIPADVRDERGWHPVGGCGGNADAWHLTTDTLDTAGTDELLRDMRMYAVLVARILDAEVLPFDHARNAERHHDIVSEYDRMAGDAFDFGATLDRLRDLQSAVEAFDADVDAGRIDSAVANETITRLSRILTRLNFTSEGQFEQDPAFSRPPYPRFGVTEQLAAFEADSDEYRFARLELKRAQNDVVHQLERARRLVESA